MTDRTTEPLAGLTFEAWLENWKDEIEQTQAFTKSDLPASAMEIQADLNRTTREFPRMAELLAEVESLLTKCRAQETLSVKCDPQYEDFAAPERKIIVDSRLTHIARTRDILRATCRSLEERSYALLNQRNFARQELRMTGHGE